MGKMIKVKHKGSFKHTEKFYDRSLKQEYVQILRQYGEVGVELLKNATPKDSGATADSWEYEIEKGRDSVSIAFTNHNENNGVNIVLLLVYGHGLQNGGYVQGNDFVHPTLAPLFQELADKAWTEVTK